VISINDEIIDKVFQEKIRKIIEENTGANYEGHSKKQKERIDAKIAQNKLALESFTSEQICEIDAYVDLLEQERDLSHIAVHIDMDAFFASVEMRDDPSLRDIPMAVGSESMLSTSNYVARRFGVRSAMPGFIAKKLCPELKIVPCNFSKYKKASHEAMKIFEEYDSNFLMASLDEAYMDITDYLAKRKDSVRYMGDCHCRLPLLQIKEDVDLKYAKITEEKCEKCGNIRTAVQNTVTFGTNVDEVVEEIRFRVEQSTGLTCSAGIGPNSMIAKISSDMKKPNGQFRVLNDKKVILDFMRELPIRKVSGIGSVTEAILKGLGINTCGDLYEKRAILSLLFSQKTLEHFICIALGIKSKEYRRKSISNEKTFQATSDLKKLQEDLCDQLIHQLPKHEILGGYSAICKMKFSTFDLITRFLVISSSKYVMAYFISENDVNSLVNESVKNDILPCCSSMSEEFSTSESPFFNDMDSSSDADSELKISTYSCPICSIKLSPKLSLVNRHVDECLNK
uniref:DNA polymerase kappa n=1 Tax=Syphacia muris TaxID=451379 RepID=A0A0N5ATE3_9BILA